MSKFVKKIGKQEFYEIDGIRAAGVIPYYIKNNEVKLLINMEYRKSELFNNVIGGKVDRRDKIIEDTMIREFNEETGFLVSDIMKFYDDEIEDNTIFFQKPKYKLSLLNITDSITWQLLPYNYEHIFKDVEQFHDRDSERLIWIDLFSFKGEQTYLLSLILNSLKNHKLFKKYNPYREPLFID